MKIKITESQLNNLRKVISEGNTAVDDLNNIIDLSDFTYESDYTRVTFDKVMLEGDIEDGLSVLLSIDKIIYYYDGEQDVTGFASTWALKDFNSGEDLPLASYISIYVSEVINSKYTKYIGTQVSEWDVIIE